ncbi:hypothetical protein [Brevundimonas sp. FT23028]|uniref:hypothetical protein n=1 Tax=Brevundimonas sp. FT23028 TaxID=3393748 RepID=UPI003B586409
MSASLHELMREACAAVAVEPPKRRLTPGVWTRTDSKGKNGKNDAAVFLDDNGNSGVAHNYQTGKSQRFSLEGLRQASNDNNPERDRERARRDREEELQRQEVERVCARIVSACREDRHAYFDKKGFPDELGLVCDDPRPFFPDSRLGEALARSLPDAEGKPLLIIPGRIGSKLVTVQFITVSGVKKNILKGQMGGSFHRIATGRDTWVCEGIGTALTVRAALRLLGANATVLSAFSASNVGRVAESIAGSRIAADHDKPVEGLENQGAGEFYARRTGRRWVMPPEMGDFNDMHMAPGDRKENLRAVALRLREVMG